MYSNIQILFLSILIIYCKAQNENERNDSPLVNAKIYSSIFVRRREEHKTLLDHFQRTEKYDRKYKLLEIGLNQILTVLRENRDKLLKENYATTSQGFPKTAALIDAFSLIVENTCLMGDLILHMPDMSEKILSKDKKWKEIVDWAIQFSTLRDVIDPKTLKMLSLFDQEIHVEKRTNDYINPYREVEQASTTNKRTKPKKKLKRGPQLHSTSRTEL